MLETAAKNLNDFYGPKQKESAAPKGVGE